MAGWEEQWERIERWYRRVEAIYKGKAPLLHTDGAGVTNEPQPAGGEHPKDEVYGFFQNCYHLKDWLTHDPSVSVSTKDVVEDFINNSPHLSRCADLCNRTKHSELTRPARAGDKGIHATQSVVVRVGTGVFRLGRW